MKGNFHKISVPLILCLAVLVLIGFFVWEILKIPKIPKVEKPEMKVKKETPIAQFGLASGKQVYEIVTQKPKDPQIIEVEVDPLDVELGKNQIVTVKVKTKANAVTGKDSVSGTVILDEKSIDFDLKLKKAEGEEELITTWQGEWKREGSIDKNYQLIILAKNINGEDQVTLTFK